MLQDRAGAGAEEQERDEADQASGERDRVASRPREQPEAGERGDDAASAEDGRERVHIVDDDEHLAVAAACGPIRTARDQERTPERRKRLDLDPFCLRGGGAVGGAAAERNLEAERGGRDGRGVCGEGAVPDSRTVSSRRRCQIVAVVRSISPPDVETPVAMQPPVTTFANRRRPLAMRRTPRQNGKDAGRDDSADARERSTHAPPSVDRGEAPGHAAPQSLNGTARDRRRHPGTADPLSALRLVSGGRYARTSWRMNRTYATANEATVSATIATICTQTSSRL